MSENKLSLPPAPRGFRLWVYQLPRYFYEVGLGSWMGPHLLMIVHRGRKSGRIYHAVLRVFHYDATHQGYTVLAVYGKQTDWYRNVQASPVLEIRKGTQRFLADQRILSEDEIYAILSELAQQDVRRLSTYIRLAGYAKFAALPTELRQLSAIIGGITFTPQSS